MKKSSWSSRGDVILLSKPTHFQLILTVMREPLRQTILRNLTRRLQRDVQAWRKIPYLRASCTFRKNQRPSWPRWRELEIIGGVKRTAKESIVILVLTFLRSRNAYDGKSDSFVRRGNTREEKKKAILTCQTINERRRIVGLYPRNATRWLWSHKAEQRRNRITARQIDNVIILSTNCIIFPAYLF